MSEKTQPIGRAVLAYLRQSLSLTLGASLRAGSVSRTGGEGRTRVTEQEVRGEL